MQTDSFISQNRNIIIAISFAVINTLSICFILNTPFFYDTSLSHHDLNQFNIKFILLANGAFIALFFIALKYLKSLTLTKLILIFVIMRIGLFIFLTSFNYGLEIDFEGTWSIMVDHIWNGDLFTGYQPIENITADWWRLVPPLTMWWYVYNFFVYQLIPSIWRFVNFLLEIGIVLVIIQIFKENKTTEKGFNEEHFKLGLSFYIFSIFPIFAISLYGNFIAFPVLLSLIGFLYYFRSKRDSIYIYLAVFFFALCALSAYYGAIWIIGILLLLLLRKEFKRLIIVGVEIVGVFCLVSLPLLINDAFGFMIRLLWVYQVEVSYFWASSIWAFDHAILKFLPTLFTVSVSAFYIYKNYDREISLDFFIVIVSIFLIFSPNINPWYVLWILPLISLNIMHSFRKYIITNLLFLGYLITYCLDFAVLYLMGYLFPYNASSFVFILQMVGQTLFQIGLIYLIYSYSNSAKLTFALIQPFILYYTIYLPFCA